MITEQQIHERVVYWQGVLAALGISHWNLEYVKIVQYPGGSPSSEAGVWKSDDYDTCRMEFKRSAVEEANEIEELDETIVHEWLHVAFRDYDEAIQSISSTLAPTISDLWDNRLEHEVEGLIERLATLIVELHDF